MKLAALAPASHPHKVHRRDQRLAIVNLALVDQPQQLGERHQHHLNALIIVKTRLSRRQPLGQKHLHPLRQKSRARVITHELRPLLRSESRFFLQLPLRRNQPILIRIDLSRRHFIQKLPRRMPILPLQHNHRIFLLRVIDRQNHHRSSVPHNVAHDNAGPRLLNLFLIHVKKRPLIHRLGRAYSRRLARPDLQLPSDHFNPFRLTRNISLRLLRRHPALSVIPSYGNIRLVAKNDRSIAVIGPGNWGSSLIAALIAANLAPREVLGRTWRRPQLDADVLWLCVPDATIARIAQKIVAYRKNLRGQIVVHSSGALSAGVLRPARDAGAKIAAVHPVMSFPARAIVPLKNVMFGVEASDAVTRRTLFALVRRIGGVSFAIRPENKAVYHAAGTFASPLLVSTLTAAMEAASLAGLDQATATVWVKALAEATVANVFQRGPRQSFSGPFARGDAHTIHLHLRALEQHPILTDVYCSLARHAIAALPVKHRRELEQAVATPTDPAHKLSS